MAQIDPRLLYLDIPEMDKDHEQLVSIANRISALVEQPDFRLSDFSTELRDLKRYTVDHFAREEAYMARIAYPGLAEHKLQHAKIMEALAALATEGPTKGAKIALSLRLFTQVWLYEHISGDDAKYAKFAKDKA
jgi:hemerythrin-like metal-binding protein